MILLPESEGQVRARRERLHLVDLLRELQALRPDEHRWMIAMIERRLASLRADDLLASK